MKYAKQAEQFVVRTKEQKDSKVTMKVVARVYGRPRFRLGVWLIKLGVWLSQVHVKVWIEEERKR